MVNGGKARSRLAAGAAATIIASLPPHSATSGGQGLGAGGHDLLGGGGGADDRDLVHARAAQRGPGVTESVHDLENRLLGNHLGEPVG